MAKIQLFCDSGANIHSCRESEIIDTVEDWGLNEGEWEGYDEDERDDIVKEWAYERLEYFYKTVED